LNAGIVRRDLTQTRVVAQKATRRKLMANTQDLRDKNGRLLGKITTTSGGKLEGRDQNGRLKGTYDPKSNETRNANGAT
jgi:hypothetical protein